jgi:hypothetical protein
MYIRSKVKDFKRGNETETKRNDMKRGEKNRNKPT